eukprot:601330_1
MPEPNQSKAINQDPLLALQALATVAEKVDRLSLTATAGFKATAEFKCEFCGQLFHLEDRLIEHLFDAHPLPDGISTSLKALTIQSESPTTVRHQSQRDP